MRKHHILGVALLALLAFSAALTSSAFGLTTQFLRNAETFSSEYLVSAVGKVLLEESITKPQIVCETTQATSDINVLSATDADVLAAPLTNCKAVNLGNAPCTVTLDGLKAAAPEEYWLVTLELVGAGARGKITKGEAAFAVPGWNASCEAIGIKFAALCEALLSVGGAEDYSISLSNLPGGAIDALFEAGEIGRCSTGGTGFVEGLEELLDAGGLALAISEA
jgi:hypothetical protein